MEITSNSTHYSIPLVVGRRIAQIVFFPTEGTRPATLSSSSTSSTGSENVTSYNRVGKYQTARTLAEVQASWSPTQMLPKMYQDRECFAKPPQAQTLGNSVAE